MRVCVNRTRGRYCLCSAKTQFWMISEAILIPKIYARLQEIASNFLKNFGGGPPDPPPALAPLALGSGLRPLTGPPFPKFLDSPLVWWLWIFIVGGCGSPEHKSTFPRSHLRHVKIICSVCIRHDTTYHIPLNVLGLLAVSGYQLVMAPNQNIYIKCGTWVEMRFSTIWL